jgi:hypothetical protein
MAYFYVLILHSCGQNEKLHKKSRTFNQYPCRDSTQLPPEHKSKVLPLHYTVQSNPLRLVCVCMYVCMYVCIYLFILCVCVCVCV